MEEKSLAKQSPGLTHANIIPMDKRSSLFLHHRQWRMNQKLYIGLDKHTSLLCNEINYGQKKFNEKVHWPYSLKYKTYGQTL